MGSLGHWWSSTEDLAHIGVSAWSWFLLNNGSNISRFSYGMNNCLSVRCLSDNPSFADATRMDDLEIFPNPATHVINIRNYTSPDTFVCIFNIQGELVLKIKEATQSIDISKLTNGIYILKIIDNTKNKIVKFIKE